MTHVHRKTLEQKIQMLAWNSESVSQKYLPFILDNFQYTGVAIAFQVPQV